MERQGYLLFTYQKYDTGGTDTVNVSITQKTIVYYSFEVIPSSVTVGYQTSAVTFTVSGDTPHWTVSATSQWITYVGQTGDTISFAVSENTGDTRQGSIVFRYESDNFGNTSTLDVGLTQQEPEPVYQITYHASSQITPHSDLTPYIIEHTYSNGYGVIVLDESMTVLPYRSFEGSTQLTEMTLPNGITDIGWDAFNDCSALSSVTLPNTVTYIGNGAFRHCSSLSAITIPNSVKRIYHYSFYGCLALSSVTIPASVIYLGTMGSAFGECPALSSITVDSGNSVYDSRGNCNAVINTSANTLVQGCYTTVIPNTVTSIGDYAFYGCASLSSITIPDSVTTIGEEAFAGCRVLSSITIPNTVTSIGEAAFNNCYSLTSVTIPETITIIEEFAFNNCYSLTSVTIPSGVRYIQKYAFDTCSSLTSITVLALTPPQIYDYAFTDTNNCPIYVPAASVDTYKASISWRTYKNRIQAIP